MKVQDDMATKLIVDSYMELNALFMLKTDKQTFLSRILSISEDEIVVSSPMEDYPLPDMTVELHFHDELGWYCFESVVKAAPDFDNPQISLSRPISAERFVHRKYTRVSTELEVQYKPIGSGDYRKAKILDLSVGGVLLQTDHQVDIEQNIEIKLSLPGQEIPPLTAMPCREMPETSEDTPPYYTGYEFVELSRETMYVIQDYLRRKLQERKS